MKGTKDDSKDLADSLPALLEAQHDAGKRIDAGTLDLMTGGIAEGASALLVGDECAGDVSAARARERRQQRAFAQFV